MTEGMFLLEPVDGVTRIAFYGKIAARSPALIWNPAAARRRLSKIQ
jgi:hypothetical protein